ncbi:MAG: cation:dicarboxylate symporter family transporter [Alphaproteobacteria bacterium]|nr:dicarboxylate/amino acid:cation symporter [Alphaproteobacteria bacterium]
MFKKICLSLSFQLIVIVGLVFTFGHFVPVPLKAASYGLALTLKEGLVWCIPFVIFSYMFSCLTGFRQGAGKFAAGTFIACLLLGVCLSNASAAFLAYGVAHTFLGSIGVMPSTCLQPTLCLEPLWSFSLPKLVANDHALMAGVMLSFFAPFVFSPDKVQTVSKHLKQYADFLLNKIFIPFLPVLVLGFVFKMQHEGLLTHAFGIYGKVVLLFAITQCAYLLFLYALSAGFHPKTLLERLQAVLPSALAAFTTMSSLAALSFTLKGARDNTKNDPLVDAVIPSTANIHLIGDSIAIPMMALAIMASYSISAPSLAHYSIFVLYFVVNKFAVAAVPGGGIIVMLPVLEQHLGFSNEMLSLIMMLYILFDAVSTTANVLGNGAFSVIFTKIFRKITSSISS